MPFYLRKAFAKFRHTDNRFNIELDRNYSVQRNEVICLHCFLNDGLLVLENEYPIPLSKVH